MYPLNMTTQLNVMFNRRVDTTKAGQSEEEKPSQKMYLLLTQTAQTRKVAFRRSRDTPRDALLLHHKK